MGPKIRAACRFAERTGGLAAIGSLAEAPAILDGRSGTRIRTLPQPVTTPRNTPTLPTAMDSPA